LESLQLLLVAAVGLSVDQASKTVVAHRVGGGTFSLGRFLQIRVVDNVADNGRTSRMMLIVWTLAAASILLLVSRGLYFETTIARVGLGLALGGAAGNLFDRVHRGRIIDFVKIGFWPVFNLADMAIVVGLPLAFGSFLGTAL